MAIITFSDVPRSVLAGLLDIAGKAEGISPRPLMGKPGELDPHQKAELFAGGYIDLPEGDGVALSPAFVQVAQALLNPHTNVTFRVWGQDNICGETNIQFPRDIMQGDGVILNQTGGFYHIRAFVDDSHLTELIGKALPAIKEEKIAFEFDGLFDAPVAAILFGILDLARIHANSGLRPGESSTDLILSIQQIYEYLSERWGLSSFKDLITYIAPTGLLAEPPSLSQTVDGVRSLVKAGLVKENKADRYQLELALEPLVNLTIGLESGMQWQRIALMDSGELIVSNRICLFGDKSFMLGLSPATKGQIYISRVRQKEIRDFLLDEMTATLSSPAKKAAIAPPIPTPAPIPMPVSVPTPLPMQTPLPDAASPAPKNACAGCGAALGPDAKHCSNCGSPVAAQQPQSGALVCPQCGQNLKAGAKFCGKCGAAIAMRQSQPALPACSQCGQSLKPGAKFCGKCGSTIAIQQSQPALPACSQCGQSLKPGAKFCGKCGKKI